MQPDQETVEKEDPQGPPGYRSDGVAIPLSDQPIPRHHDGGGASGVSSGDVPQDDLRPGGHNWNPDQQVMADRVRAAREALYPSGQPVDLPEDPSGGWNFEQATEVDVQAFLDQVAAADARNAAPPTVKATRRGRNAHTTKGSRRRVAETAKPARNQTPPIPAASSCQGGRIDIDDDNLLAEAGVVPFYSTIEAAQFFDKTNQWMYWGLRTEIGGKPVEPVFTYADGSPIVPERVGDPESGRRRFTLPIIKAILLSNYRRGNVEPDELKRILRRIRINELGGEWREREGWKKVRGKWVHPSELEKVGRKWVRKKPEEDQDVE